LGEIEFTIAGSSFGNIVLVSRNGRLVSLDIVSDDPLHLKKSLYGLYPDGQDRVEPFRDILRALDRYFKGERVNFEIDLDLDRLGAFSRLVLAEVSKVPYGRTATYTQIGRLIGHPKAARAVGQALKRNPIPIIVPCHRVIRADGSLGGFALGLEMKARLLTIEGVPLDKSRNIAFPS